jgi:hypothetical protein
MTAATARLAGRIAAVVLLAIGIAVLWWALFIRPGDLKNETRVATSGAVVATGEAAKAADAARIVENTHEIERTIERQTITNERVIRAAPGAGDAVSADVDRAGRAALCLRHAYRLHPACQQLSGAGAGLDAGADAGRAPAGG